MFHAVLKLPCDRKSPSLARRFIDEFTDLAIDGTAHVVRMIASELVSNAVIHGAAPVELTLRYDRDEVCVEVADGDPAIDNVKLRAPGRLGTGAYGLRIVASLADRWGIRSLPSGKTVWATITKTSPA